MKSLTSCSARTDHNEINCIRRPGLQGVVYCTKARLNSDADFAVCGESRFLTICSTQCYKSRPGNRTTRGK